MRRVNPRISEAKKEGKGIVGLESVVFCHGLPKPHGELAALEAEDAIREEGAEPATCAVIKGDLVVGLTSDEIKHLAAAPPRKTGPSSLAAIAAQGTSGATTAGATMLLSHSAGIRVVATGGIGGVHRGTTLDVSADLHVLSRLPLVVVCSGAKSILDLAATFELLESLEVTVIGYRTSELPGFYARETGISLNNTADSPKEITQAWHTARLLGMSAALLVVNPPPSKLAFPRNLVEHAISDVFRETTGARISGPMVTPAQLEHLQHKLGPQAIELNRALLVSNARLAAQISTLLA